MFFIFLLNLSISSSHNHIDDDDDDDDDLELYEKYVLEPEESATGIIQSFTHEAIVVHCMGIVKNSCSYLKYFI